MKKIKNAFAGAVRDVQFTRPSIGGLASALARFITGNTVVLIALLLVLAWQGNATPVATLPASAASMYQAASYIGSLWLILWMCWRFLGALMDVSSAETSVPVFAVLAGALERGTMLVLALTAIRRFAPDVAALVQSIESKPAASIAVVAGFLVVYAAFSALPSRRYSGVIRSAVAMPGIVGGAVSANIRRPRSPQAVRRTAVHEAGHALLYAALPELPAKMTVTVLAKISMTDVYRGSVASDWDWTEAETESAMRLRMLIDLGGTVAEQVVFGERADGAGGDNERWTVVAERYLACGFGEPYFGPPANASQTEHNRLVLGALKSAQYSALIEFCQLNRAVMDDMTERLVETSQLDRADVAQLLERVQFTSSIRPVQLH